MTSYFINIILFFTVSPFIFDSLDFIYTEPDGVGYDHLYMLPHTFVMVCKFKMGLVELLVEVLFFLVLKFYFLIYAKLKRLIYLCMKSALVGINKI